MVPHLSTRHAHTGCLASEMRRDLSFPTRYDRTEDSSRVTSPDSGAVATRPRSIYRSTSKQSPQEKGTQDYDQNLTAGCVHMEPFFATHSTIICNLFSLGYVEQVVQRRLGCHQTCFQAVLGSQTKSFLCYFWFVCVNLSPANLLQGGCRPASRGQNKYSTQG